MKIIDEDDKHEEKEKNERQYERENRVILGIVKENRTRDKIEQSKSGIENHFPYFFKGKQFPSNGVK